MNPTACELVKAADPRLVISFLNNCLGNGRAFELAGRKFCFEGKGAPQDVTRGTLRALAVALLLSTEGALKTTYDDLWRCAVDGDSTTPSSEVLRRFASTLRTEWASICAAADVSDENAAALPASTNPIRLACLGYVFDVSKARDFVHVLRPPQLHVSYKGQPKPPISLDVLKAGAWKVVGRLASDDCPDKIRIDHDEYLSRKAFEIMLSHGCLHVRLVSTTNKLMLRGREVAEFDVRHGEEFSFANLTFRFGAPPSDDGKATPVHRPRSSLRSEDF